MYLRIVLLCCTYIHRGLKIIPIAHVFRYVEVASSIVGGVPVVLTYVRGSLQIRSKIRLIIRRIPVVPESAVKLYCIHRCWQWHLSRVRRWPRCLRKSVQWNLTTKDNVRCIAPTFRMEQNANIANNNVLIDNG